MLRFDEVSRAFGSVRALDAVSFGAGDGAVTGLVGPNGSGKTTAMRILLGLERADAGAATVDGRAFAGFDDPMSRVGALLDARAMHPGRRAREHLRALASTHGIGPERVDAVLEEAGLGGVSHRRIGTFSLGMRQRLGIAAMLLGDPANLVLDEPVNGLDPDGVLWLRTSLRRWADDGRAVLLSSHLIAELSLTVDHVVVLGRGRVLADEPLARLHELAGGAQVVAQTPRASELAARLGDGATLDGSTVTVRGTSAIAVGRVAAEAGIALSGLTVERPSLEDVYRYLTSEARDYEARTP